MLELLICVENFGVKQWSFSQIVPDQRAKKQSLTDAPKILAIHLIRNLNTKDAQNPPALSLYQSLHNSHPRPQ